MSYNAEICLAMPRVKMKEVHLQTTQPIETLYEDDELIAVHKPAWYLVHPSYEARDALDVLSTLKVRGLAPIHRLDRQTSGILLLSKNPEFTQQLQAIWPSERVEKRYLAYVYGRPPYEFEAKRALTDLETKTKKEACTVFKTLEYFEKGALVEARIFTGRRHQIRRHLSHLGHHILGDRMYGKGRINNWARSQGLERLFLHSHSLVFWHPFLKKKIVLDCPLPKDLSLFLSQR